jgi:hypothetical protein
MKTARIVALLVLANAALAQRQPARQSLDEWITNTEKHLIDLAEAMPEEKYSFAPTNGEFTGVRTFAEQVKHLAANNYGMSARIEGRRNRPCLGEDEGGDRRISQRIVRRIAQSRRGAR